jgi:hypothetical protein
VKSVCISTADNECLSQRRLGIRVCGCALVVVALVASATRGQAVQADRDHPTHFALTPVATASTLDTAVVFPSLFGQSKRTVDALATVEDETRSDTATGLPLEDTSEKPSGWDFTLAPYLWLLSVSADIEAGPISAETDVCVTDLLQNLDLIAQMRFEGLHKQR